MVPPPNTPPPHHHVIGITAGDDPNNPNRRRDWLISVEAKISQPPKLLNESAGKDCCSIFRVPQSLKQINQKAYQPHLLSIGPYYHGRPELQMIQEHKARYLRAVLARTTKHGVGLDRLFQALESKEEAIKDSYSETIQVQDKYQLMEMMVFDGCFVLELFRKVYQIDQDGDEDPLLKIVWVLTFIARDLLMLENQLPLFVLQTLFDPPILAVGDDVPSLNTLVLEFFSKVVGRPVQVLERHDSIRGKHILDLFRLSLIPPSPPNPDTNLDVKLIPSAEKLHRAGIQFKSRKSADCFVDIKFSNGVLQIPTLTLDDFSTCFLLNCVAFEQCHRYCSTDITTYATFMGCLINTPGDVGFLRDRKIIENYIGADDQVALFFNNLGKDMPTDISESYLTELFDNVNKYIGKGWRVHWEEFKSTYFGTRWSFISAIAASVLLILTMIQAFYAVYPYAITHKHGD